jgi:hypothetical protein
MWDKDRMLHARTWTKDKSVQNDRQHLSYGMSLKSRDDYNINVGLYGESRGGNDGRGQRGDPEVHQRGEDVLPLPT